MTVSVLACTRVRRHRVRCFDGAGGGSWRDGSSRGSFKLEAVRLIKDRAVSYVQASQDLNVHTSQLRDWVKKFSEDPQHALVTTRSPSSSRSCVSSAKWRS